MDGVLHGRHDHESACRTRGSTSAATARRSPCGRSGAASTRSPPGQRRRHWHSQERAPQGVRDVLSGGPVPDPPGGRNGPGLALVRSVVAGHKGKDPCGGRDRGVGTTFRMRFPLVRGLAASTLRLDHAFRMPARRLISLARTRSAAMARWRPRNPRAMIHRLSDSQVHPGLKRRVRGARTVMSSSILIVEDDPVHPTRPEAQPGVRGLQVELARDGEEAIQRAFDKKPDLIVPRHHVAPRQRVRGLPHGAQVRLDDPDPDPLRQGRRGRQGPRARAGRGRLHRQAVLDS